MDELAQKQKSTSQTKKVLDNFFRQEYARSISSLTRIFGKENFELIEDSVQESLIKAMQVWPYHSIPDNPSSWILSVARNKIIDSLRRKANFQEKKDEIHHLNELNGKANYDTEPIVPQTEFADDQLRMMFSCCHPLLKKEQQIILTLKILCGLSIAEIAKALLKKETAVAKTYTRAKAKLQETHFDFEVPPVDELNQRLEVVLSILYLLFNEGYASTDGGNLVRKELCLEAIRLTHILLENKRCQLPEAYALLSLMYFQASRLEVRTNEQGELLTLEEQNRELWDKQMITHGLYYLTKGSTGEKPSEYLLQAAIAACHSVAKDFDSTDWRTILQSYDWLLRLKSSPVVALNRLVAYAKIHGTQHALQELRKIEQEKPLTNYHLYYAIKSELLAESGCVEEARSQLETAIRLTKNSVEKNHLKKKLDRLLLNSKSRK